MFPSPALILYLEYHILFVSISTLGGEFLIQCRVVVNKQCSKTNETGGHKSRHFNILEVACYHTRKDTSVFSYSYNTCMYVEFRSCVSKGTNLYPKLLSHNRSNYMPLLHPVHLYY